MCVWCGRVLYGIVVWYGAACGCGAVCRRPTSGSHSGAHFGANAQ